MIFSSATIIYGNPNANLLRLKSTLFIGTNCQMIVLVLLRFFIKV